MGEAGNKTLFSPDLLKISLPQVLLQGKPEQIWLVALHRESV